MNDPLYDKLLERSWRRKLSQEEEAELRAWLAAHPEARQDWEAEAELNKAFGRLPDVPVATNFTARVVSAAERIDATPARSRANRWSWRWLLPKAAVAVVAMGIGVFSYKEYRQTQRERIAGALLTLSSVSTTASPQDIKDLNSIASLSQPGPDEELLRLLSSVSK